MRKTLLRILCTLLITLIYCLLWMVTEKLITGQIQDRLVDNIIMALFVPVIWLATSPICNKLMTCIEKRKKA